MDDMGKNTGMGARENGGTDIFRHLLSHTSMFPYAPSLWCLGLLLWLPAAAKGQVQVTCSIPQNRSVQYESVPATVEIYNTGGQAIDFSGADPQAHLLFHIEQTPGRSVRQLGDIRFDEPLVVRPGERVRRTVNLMEVYDLRSTGPYNIHATVYWAGQMFASPKVYLDILPGLEINRLINRHPSNPQRTQIFSLRTLHRGRGDYLFVRIDDEALGLCRGVYDLGRLLRPFEPVLQADVSGQVHILHQSGPTRYTHSIFTADGNPVAQDLHSSAASVRLEEAPDGRLVVKMVGTSQADLDREAELLEKAMKRFFRRK